MDTGFHLKKRITLQDIAIMGWTITKWGRGVYLETGADRPFPQALLAPSLPKACNLILEKPAPSRACACSQRVRSSAGPRRKRARRQTLDGEPNYMVDAGKPNPNQPISPLLHDTALNQILSAYPSNPIYYQGSRTEWNREYPCQPTIYSSFTPCLV